MVATLLSLRFRVLANTLRRNPVQLAAVVAGAVPALLLLAVSLVAFAAAPAAPFDLVQAATVTGGALLMLGWLLGPLLLDGVEDTLDPLRLARFPLRRGQLMTATLLAGIAWVPGGATLLGSMGMALAWPGHPSATLAAAGCGILATVTCLAGARAATGWAGRMLRGRGAARAAVGAIAALVLVVPVGAALAGRRAAAPSAPPARVVEVLGWTPFGAVWSIPGRLADGDMTGALLASAIALATCGGFLALWWLALGPPRRPASGPRPALHSTIGVFGIAPSTQAGAVAARSLISWFRDSRRARQLLLVPAVPLMLLLWWRLTGWDALVLATGPLVAALLPLSAFAEVSYDGTAFTTEVAAGVRGRADRAGRAGGMLIIALPAVTLVQLAMALTTGMAEHLPALLGMTIAVLLASTGVAAVSSSLIVVPVPRVGRSPLAVPAGAATISVAASYAVLGVTFVVTAPVVALAVFAILTGSTPAGWATLGFGVAVGVGALVAGVIIGGRILDRRAPELLAQLRRLAA